MIRCLPVAVLLLLAAAPVTPLRPQTRPLPKVLFFANPMSSDNDVIRRAKPDELSVAERHFAELSKGVFDVTITQNGSEVTPEKLTRYRAVVFFTAINPPGVDRDGLVKWVEEGGAFIGIHSTANTYQNHAGFGAMLGARFDRRPWRTAQAQQTKVSLRVEHRSHPAVKHLPDPWPVADDLYQFKDFDPAKVRLLLRMDPVSLDMANPGANREDRVLPVAWAKSHGKGRVFYTALGDWEPTWKNPNYRKHLIEGIRWAMGVAPPAGGGGAELESRHGSESGGVVDAAIKR
jgi:hypothetical protein